MQAVPSSLRRVCRVLSFVAILGLLLLGMILLYFVVTPDSLDPAQFSHGPVSGLKHALLLLVLCTMLVPGAIGLLSAHRILSNYANGDVLTFENAKSIRTIGIAVICSAAFAIIGRSLSVLILTYDNPPGQRSLSISLSSHDYFYVLLGGLFFVIGWVMAEASRQADENRQFV